ncbi:MAG: site-specific DNA-methyltransferase [Candidatus Pacebacteria bacterium]|nr:site-specific DNA-methyltransferase [Candidatus Paceibacterota bacterium]
MPRKKANKKIEVKTYAHKGAKRKNIPPVGLVSSATDKFDGRQKYAHDPHIDPYLSWAGKKEGMEFDVQNISLHIHERIDPKRIIKSFLKKDTGPKQVSLFDQPDNEPPLNKAIEFYKHEQDWTNRLISGDSLLVMNSLLNKEGMAGKVQMVYIDPPYGIKYNSNFQPFVNKKDVKDRDEDIPAEPEMIQAFRDTWELGVHSYLTHLRDRLLLAKELLHESGSVFVQINEENIHHVREVMEEIFNKDNFVAMVSYKTRGVLGSNDLAHLYDIIIWYAKDKKQMKFRELFVEKNEESKKNYPYILVNKKIEKAKDDSPLEDRIALGDLNSSGLTPSCVYDYEFKGKVYKPRSNKSWKTNLEGMKKLEALGRITARGNSLYFISYYKDFPASRLTNMWFDTTAASGKSYVVETQDKVIERCMLMTTDPSDLILDPTCGGGTSAFVAEKWGRRWITCDTSRVAITLAKQRLMIANFEYYELAHKEEGIRSGLIYKEIPHISVGTFTKESEAKSENLYDIPKIEKNKIRVTGPFTVEAVPSLRVKPFDEKEPKVEGGGRELSQTGETGNQTLYRDELKTTGIRTTGGKKIEFSVIEPMLATKFLHAKGEIIEKDKTKKAYISFGPDFGPMEQRQVEEAVKEAREIKEKPDFVIFAAFHFDPEAAKDIDQIDWSGVQILKAQMSVDLLTADLRKKRSSNQSYWLIGQPDVEVIKERGEKYKIRVNGFDYYNPISGEIESKSNAHIAMWFLDTDYDERSLLPDQVFFPMKDSKRDWTKLAKALNGEIDEELIESFTGVESLPFEAGEEKKIAVKIIDNRGIESFVIKKLE